LRTHNITIIRPSQIFPHLQHVAIEELYTGLLRTYVVMYIYSPTKCFFFLSVSQIRTKSYLWTSSILPQRICGRYHQVCNACYV